MPYDVDQLDNLDDELDALATPTSLEVLLHTRDYDAGFVAASAARRAIESVGGGGPPTGGAGGVLAGTYPNPSFAADMATQSELNAVQTTADAAVPKALFDANTVLAADTDNTPAAVTMAASTILARLAAGNIKAASPSELRTLLALVIGTNVQAWDADLDSIAAVTSAADKMLYATAAQTWTVATLTSFARTLLDDADAATALTTLGAAAALVTENIQTASYTLVLGDAGKRVVMNNGSANNLTVPTNASVAFPTGTTIEVFQLGAGQTTLVMTSLTSQSPSAKKKLTGQYSSATLCKRDTDTWSIAGDLSA